MAKLNTPFLTWLTRRLKITAETGSDKGLHGDLFTASCLLLEEGWSEEAVFNLLNHQGPNRTAIRMLWLGYYLEAKKQGAAGPEGTPCQARRGGPEENGGENGQTNSIHTIGS